MDWFGAMGFLRTDLKTICQLNAIVLFSPLIWFHIET